MTTVRYTAARGGPDAVRVVGYGSLRVGELLEVADRDLDGLLVTGNWEVYTAPEPEAEVTPPKRKRKTEDKE